MDDSAPRYSLLRELSRQSTSEQRRELLRKVTDALDSRAPSQAEFDELDGVLSAVAKEYSTQVRTEFAAWWRPASPASARPPNSSPWTRSRSPSRC